MIQPPQNQQMNNTSHELIETPFTVPAGYSVSRPTIYRPPDGENAAPPELPKAVSLMMLMNQYPDPEKTLLGDRFLCRSGAMVFVGPSGIGKSSANVQMDIAWAQGKPAFGIKPAKPLKILTIQAENDDGDLGEMARGVMAGIDWDSMGNGEKIDITDRVLYVTEKSCTGMLFLNQVVEPLLELHRPDIIRIDPLLAYLGGDVNQAVETAKFLRNGLNPLLEKYDCGAIVVHHTPKNNKGGKRVAH